MNQRSLKKYQIDTRTEQDVEERIKELARSYTPEWLFKTSSPDIGSTIGRIFARQLQENIRAANEILEVYHMQFVNFLDLTLRRAVPAGSVAVFSISEMSLSGVLVPKGTRILPEYDEDTGTPVFETEQALFVTGASITDMFMTDREDGVIVPLLGNFPLPEFFEGEQSALAGIFPGDEAQQEEEAAPGEAPADDVLKPFMLFGERKTIGRHTLMITDPRMFDVGQDGILLMLEGNRNIMNMVREGRIAFSYLTEQGIMPFSECTLTQGDKQIMLRKDVPARRITIDGTETDVVFAHCEGPVVRTEEITDIRLKSAGSEAPPDYVGDGNSDMNVSDFVPFTDTLSVYAECYIGKDAYFDKPGARIHISFSLLFRENVMSLEQEEAKAELKIIKRRERAARTQEFVNVFADEISIEYFNGTGWKRLIFDREYRALFRTAQGGEIRMSFLSPPDWQTTESGSYSGRLLRLRLLKSDNCYMRPAIHHYPVMERMLLSYSYEGNGVRPERLVSINGTRRTDLTGMMNRGKIPVFAPIPYTEDALYIGFDKKMDSGPIGIYFELASSAGHRPLKCRFEYSSRRGFQQMRVVDRTEGFSRSGIVLFMPPSDFYKTELEQKNLYWMRIVRATIQEGEEDIPALPKIMTIRLNAVDIINISTGDEEEFYIDEVSANMHFPLGTSNILDADVFVNEKDTLSAVEMESLLAEHPEDVRAEYGMSGEIESFYVRWRETQDFTRGLNSREENPFFGRRVYRLDRLTGEILFADGILAEIPRVTDDVAFLVRLRTCVGDAGNLPAGTLTRFENDMIFIDEVTNPVRAYGGGDMETVPQALMRGANIIHSRGRIVSERDFKRAILSFSEVIDKVHCVMGHNERREQDPAELVFVLLMKDFADGSFSFHRVRTPLKRHLLENCDMAVTEKRLHIMEPVFVSISSILWAEVMSIDESFQVQQDIRAALDEYLNPVTGGSHERERGWKIGTMPKKAQILMRLSGISENTVIRKTSFTASYTDRDGFHEINYDDLQVTPFMVCKSGEHQVHILYGQGDAALKRQE